MKRWVLGGLGVVLLGAMVWSFSGAAESVLPSRNSTPNDGRAANLGDDPLVVHEWGTFTSYSGSDGGRLEFRPLFDDDLPHFVQDRSTGSGFGVFSKVSYRSLVRMETPITYFYTKQPRDVRVKVAFPEGLLTEFYPPAAISPPYKGYTEPQKNSALDWGTVRLIPEDYLAPKMDDARLAKVIAKRTAQALPPHADYNNHYAYARQTDAALVHLQQPALPKAFIYEPVDHFEKFLFYRGLGNFKLPMKVQALGKGKALVNNSGAEPIAWMMLLDVNGEELRFASFDGVGAGQQREVALPANVSTIDDLAAELTSALVSTGLYEKEAVAMVNTWRSSWFGEQGTRLLYFVPQSLTDQLLPLTIEPKPAETIRVLVGRLDLMTPEQEAAITKLVKESAAARRAGQQKANDEGVAFQYQLPDAVRKLGRLAEPALTRVRHASTDTALSNEATTLIHELHRDLEEQKK
ncbi:hypothetical protein [Anatilimnocola floriformis]|uniref:hypothetical protein n=1 Tax=Anatilimnocola floriformis TaxID=2948575 RepID=UPI0020C54F28|nr:hypothetical protein [Anatilimnocola floriformis]